MIRDSFADILIRDRFADIMIRENFADIMIRDKCIAFKKIVSRTRTVNCLYPHVAKNHTDYYTTFYRHCAATIEYIGRFCSRTADSYDLPMLVSAERTRGRSQEVLLFARDHETEVPVSIWEQRI